MKKIHHMVIIENREIALETYRMTLHAQGVDFSTLEAGTFLNIRVEEGDGLMLRRPISIHEADEKAKTLSVIYKTVGEGTRKMSRMKAGGTLDVFGPLGTGFPILSDAKSVLLVGGGVGIPPLYELGKRLKGKGVTVTTVLGLRNKESLFALEEFRNLGDVLVATEDGSLGTKGFVTDAIAAADPQFDCIYACGPKGMLRALDLAYQGKKEGYLSFEERMACGIGACYGCMTKTKDGLKRVCKDGPVFRLGEVDYE